MAQKVSTRQLRQHTVLPMIGNSADEAGDSLLSKIDAQTSKLFEDRNVMLTDGGLVTFTGTQIQFTEALNLVLNQKVSGATPQIISLAATTRTVSASGRMVYAVVDRTAGTATVTDDATTLAAAASANQEVFLIGKRVDAADGTQRFYFRNGAAFNAGQTARLGSAGSGTGGSGVNGPIPGYNWLETDTFDVLKTDASSKVVNTSYTNAVQNIGKSLFKLLCDKSKTVSTNSGTALTISGGPTFTVAVGDIVYVTSGARIGQFRRIATVTNQTTYVLDAAFTGGNASAADTIMVSQAVWTADLINFGSSTDKTRARDYFSGDITQIAVDYFDSLTTDDDVPDYADTARIVMSASNSGTLATTGVPTSDTFQNSIFTRVAYPGTINNFTLGVNATQARLSLVFFPNPSNGSVTSQANLLGYECNFFADGSLTNSGVLFDALCFSDASTTAVNCSVSTPSGLTRVQLTSAYTPNVNTGGPTGQLEVWVDGKEISRFVGSAQTPTTDLYYTEQTDSNGLYTVVQFTKDLSVVSKEIKIVRRFGVYDASDSNSTKLASLAEAVVGSAAQVTAGTATHSTLQAAHDAIVAGGMIFVLNNVTITGNTTLSKQCMIQGKGPGSTITGSLTVASGAAKSIIFGVRFTSTITFNSGADKCFMTHCYQATGQTFSNSTSNLDNIIQIITE